MTGLCVDGAQVTPAPFQVLDFIGLRDKGEGNPAIPTPFDAGYRLGQWPFRARRQTRYKIPQKMNDWGP
jgi:hypothetical protein